MLKVILKGSNLYRKCIRNWKQPRRESQLILDSVINWEFVKVPHLGATCCMNRSPTSSIYAIYSVLL